MKQQKIIPVNIQCHGLKFIDMMQYLQHKHTYQLKRIYTHPDHKYIQIIYLHPTIRLITSALRTSSGESSEYYCAPLSH